MPINLEQTPQMIVTDLDRTLLRTDKTISEYTTEIFRECRTQGIKTVIATARSEFQCKKFIDNIKPDAVISNGGARARVKETEVYRAIIDKETSNLLLQEFLNHTDVGYITIETENNQYFANHPIDDVSKSYLDANQVIQTDFSNGLNCGAYKIVPEVRDKELVWELMKKFQAIKAISFTNELWVCFANKLATKWESIKAVAKYLEIDTHHIVAFGDDLNDVEMLKNCGVGVAVSNGIQEAKAASDYICESNDEDGVARWIEANILNL